MMMMMMMDIMMMIMMMLSGFCQIDGNMRIPTEEKPPIPTIRKVNVTNVWYNKL